MNKLSAWWRAAFGGEVKSVVNVTPGAPLPGGSLADVPAIGVDRALGLSAVWGCVNLLAGTVGTLPLSVYRKDGALSQEYPGHPLYVILHDRPNYEQSAVELFELVAASIELQGRAYLKISRRGGGAVVALEFMPRQEVSSRRGQDGVRTFAWRGKPLREDEVLEILGPMGGRSALSICRGVFSGALSANEMGGQVFKNGLQPSGIITTPPEVTLTAEQRAAFEELLHKKFLGAQNAGRPMLLDRGLSFEKITLTPEDAEMLATRGFTVEEICRVFGVPPFMVGHTGNSTSWGSGLEQQTLGFHKFTLRPRLKRIEQACERQLLTAADRAAGVSLRFNMEGLLRADSAGRASYYNSMVQAGIMSINEVRALENLPPVPGGELPRLQMQYQPINSTEGEA